MANSTPTTTSTEPMEEDNFNLEPGTVAPRRWEQLVSSTDRQDDRLSNEDRAAVMSLYLGFFAKVIQGSSFSFGPGVENANPTTDLEPESTFEETKEEETCRRISPMTISEAVAYFQKKILPCLQNIGKTADKASMMFTRGITKVLNPSERLCNFTGEVSRTWCQCKLVKWGRGMEVKVDKAFSGEEEEEEKFKTMGKALIKELFFHDTNFVKLLESKEIVAQRGLNIEASNRRLKRIVADFRRKWVRVQNKKKRRIPSARVVDPAPASAKRRKLAATPTAAVAVADASTQTEISSTAYGFVNPAYLALKPKIQCPHCDETRSASRYFLEHLMNEHPEFAFAYDAAEPEHRPEK